MRIIFALLLLPFAFLTGCHAYRVHNDFPIYSTNDEAGALKAAIGAARDAATNGTLTAVQRNNLQSRLMIYSDEHYYRLRDSLSKGRNWITFSAEVAGTTLSAVSALVADVDTKSIISTASTLTQSTKVSIDKDFFAQQTTSAIVAKMEARRAEEHTIIIQAQAKSLDAYGLEAALEDSIAYDDRGTLQSAIIAINADAGSQRESQEKQLVEEKHKRVSPPQGNAAPPPSNAPKTPK